MIANRDEARTKIAKAGITTENVTRLQLQLLRKCINNAMIDSGRYDGTYRMKKQATKFMQCCTNQWDGREAVSFYTDGFIGFAGWADDRNIRPILDGVEEWLDKLGIAS